MIWEVFRLKYYIMVNAQEWLDENYLNKKIEYPYEIYINQQLEGVLDLGDYDKISKASISYQVDKSKFEIKKSFYKYYDDKNEKW